MTAMPPGAFLIVNADDYGYFRCVSRGILKAATEGIVTATGIFANGTDFAEHVAWLRDCDGLDAGVHLNLTSGRPVTVDMQKRVSRWSGNFPGKFSMAMAIVSGTITSEQVRAEWRAQIERCLEQGPPIRFLNSHEHMHVLPSLFRVVSELAREFRIPHIRFPVARFGGGMPLGAYVRGAAIGGFASVNGRQVDRPVARFVGLEQSGRLDGPGFRRCVAQLEGGAIHELMCHPGQFDASESVDPRLQRYHDWNGELRTLTDPRARELLAERGVRLIGYRHLEIRDNRLVVVNNVA